MPFVAVANQVQGPEFKLAWVVSGAGVASYFIQTIVGFIWFLKKT